MKSGKLIPQMFGACAILIASLMLLMMEIEHRTVAANAERTSSAWASYVSSQMTDIEGTVASGRLTEPDREFLEGVRQFGDVFRFKMFGTKVLQTLHRRMGIGGFLPLSHM